MEDNVPAQVKANILSQRIALWEQQLYLATADFKVGQRLQDQAMQEAAKKDMQRCEVALGALREMLSELAVESNQG